MRLMILLALLLVSGSLSAQTQGAIKRVCHVSRFELAVLQVVSDGPIFSLAREKIGEKRALLTQKPPSRICSIDGRASAASHLLIREFLPKAHVIVGDG